MAGLATYTDLLSAIASYTKRGDTAALAPIWVALAEARINRELRVNDMVTRKPLSVAAEYLAVPADMAAPITIRLTDRPYWQLDYLQPAQMADRIAEQRRDTLAAFALINGQFWFNPAPVVPWNAELLYYANVPALASAPGGANWLLTIHPDVYLWAALREAADFYEDDQQLAKFEQLFTDAVKAVQAADKRDTQGVALKPMPSGNAF